MQNLFGAVSACCDCGGGPRRREDLEPFSSKANMNVFRDDALRAHVPGYLLQKMKKGGRMAGGQHPDEGGVFQRVDDMMQEMAIQLNDIRSEAAVQARSLLQRAKDRGKAVRLLNGSDEGIRIAELGTISEGSPHAAYVRWLNRDSMIALRKYVDINGQDSGKALMITLDQICSSYQDFLQLQAGLYDDDDDDDTVHVWRHAHAPAQMLSGMNQGRAMASLRQTMRGMMKGEIALYLDLWKAGYLRDKFRSSGCFSLGNR